MAKNIYSISELGAALGLSRYQIGRFLRSRGIPTEHIGRKRLVVFANFQAKAPDLAATLEGSPRVPATSPSAASPVVQSEPEWSETRRNTCSIDELAVMAEISRAQLTRYLQGCGVTFRRNEVVTLVDLAQHTPGLLKSLLIKIPVLLTRALRAHGAETAAS